jgi:riboflavin synthase alpha subunit
VFNTFPRDTVNGPVSQVSSVAFTGSATANTETYQVTINGTSLTVVDSKDDSFSVCIIPYTFENTIFKHLKVNDVVNLEFDIIGKYVARLLKK